ncbi:pilus assembly protein [Alkalimonas sp. MEB004]|uniref:Pilus assembly protein n=2 Tax=Alkalimonas mucilaginosa TaxID=3057676 RepID=A0ABU7JJ78_9GAMM|nr:pilus assembly protein [Alkalimonas sp. MEB004]MEE2025759.1 pilus assembly protein [Alkalimonas sp. MEB004]
MKVMNKRVKGQGMTEYIIIVALIAVAAIGVYSFFGETIRNQVAGLSAEVSGQNSATQIQQAQNAANSADGVANQNYNLGTYNEGANQGGGGGGD